VLVPLSSLAQVVPPEGVYQWSGAVSEDWVEGGNWVGGSAPTLGADVLFGASNSPEQVEIAHYDSAPLRSLWIDASAGINYVFENGLLQLGYGLSDDQHMVTVLSNGQQQEEVATFDEVYFFNEGTARIENYSELGLMLGSVLLAGDLKISGSGATHFLELKGQANISLEQIIGTTPTHLVIGDDGTNWTGSLTVGDHTLAFLRADYTLGTAAAHTVTPGGTLGLRSNVGSPLNYENPQGTLYVSGTGAVRRTGKPAVGAIYNDGGENTYSGDIVMTGDTWFGARGDFNGGLHLSGKIVGAGLTFTKVGSGHILLSNSENQWAETHINAGVLTVMEKEALGGGNTKIVFGGGILGLVSPNNDGVISLGIGTGPGQVSWAGSGGFAATAGNTTVKLGGGALLAVGNANFLQPGQRFLLSSRYAYSAITLDNPRNIYDAPTMSFQVDHGRSANAYAVLTGHSFNSSAATSYYEKWGDGLLWDQSNHLIASPNYHIYGGVLRSTQYGIVRFNHKGRLGLDADFLETAIWDGAGGFAAYGGDRTVRIGNSTDPITWDSNSFLKDLVFGHATATGTVVWDRELNANAYHTIYLERGAIPSRADVVFTKPLNFNGAGNARAIIEGNGRMDIAADSIHGNNDGISFDSVHSNLYIQGAELRFNGQGKMSDRSLRIGPQIRMVTIYMTMGGSIVIDNYGTHNSSTGGLYLPDRIADMTSLSFRTGNFRYIGGASGNSTETLGPLYIEDGANTISIQHKAGSGSYTEFTALTFQRISTPVKLSTLDVRGSPFPLSGGTGEVRLSTLTLVGLPDKIGGISPWATTERADWLISASTGSAYLTALTNYYTGSQGNWVASHNVFSSNSQLSGSRTINSLKLAGILNLKGHDLTLNSGGLLVAQGNSALITGNGGSSNSNTIKTASNRVLYAHIYGPLSISGSAHFDLPNGTLVKTGSGPLALGGALAHNFDKLFIYQGMIDVRGTINSPNIYIGDRSGQDILQLAAWRWNQLLGSPTVHLRGNPYSRPVAGGSFDAAILRLGGGTRQKLSRLDVEGQGVIDFRGGVVGGANILWLDSLHIQSGGFLSILNWYQYEDYLLVKKSGFNIASFPRIIFEGYEEYGATYIDYDKDYYQITPFYHISVAPEPITYGAILGAMGLGLWGWRQRTRRTPPSPEPGDS